MNSYFEFDIGLYFQLSEETVKNISTTPGYSEISKASSTLSLCNDMSSVHSPSFPSLHLRHNSFSNPSVALPTSQLILQPFRRFTYVTVHCPTLPLLHLRHSSFSIPSVALSTSQLIVQLFRCFTYVTAHSPTLPSLYLRHSSFSNSPVASPTSQLILQPFFCFPYFTGFSLTSPGEPPMFQTQTHIFWSLFIKTQHRARWLRGNARDSHSGGPGFKSRCRPN